MTTCSESRSSDKVSISREAESFYRAEKRLTSSLLAILPATMIGKRVCVTLLDDTQITGRLALVDGFLNLHLNDGVTVTPPPMRRRAPPPANQMEINISGKRVRYIVLPKSVDVKSSIEKYIDSMKSIEAPGSRRLRKADKYAYLRQATTQSTENSMGIR